ncbi:MAG: 50S ribosomal protein L9 [Elusimicrobia bacterium]|nr:50S ribosomal protein L9 [Elusimicrobiota bacterium]
MKVVLAKNIDGLGEIGEVKEVADGYARNYLMPKNLAMPATPGAIRQIEKRRVLYIEKKGRQLQKAKALKENLQKIEISIVREVHEEKKLFGSVTVSEIVDALKEKGIEIKGSQVAIEEPIKEVGIYNVAVKLHPEITASVKIWVAPKE